MLFCDNGSEFTSQATDLWAYQNAVCLDFIRPGKPAENGYIGSFNGRLRDERLNVKVIVSLTDARAAVVASRLQPVSILPHYPMLLRTSPPLVGNQVLRGAVLLAIEVASKTKRGLITLETYPAPRSVPPDSGQERLPNVASLSPLTRASAY
jgi:transposase InsO family protein